MDGEWIRDIRQRLGMSQARWAELCGATRPTVSDWERGRLPIPRAVAALVTLLRNNPGRIAELGKADLAPGDAEVASKVRIAMRVSRARLESRDAELINLHHRALAMLEDPSEGEAVRARALAAVDLWEERGAASRAHIERWRRLLGMTVDEMEPEILRPDEQGQALRWATPFGFLEKKVRRVAGRDGSA